MQTRNVHVRKGQTIIVSAGRGVKLEIACEPCGAVQIRNLVSGSLLRQWSPKEAKNP